MKTTPKSILDHHRFKDAFTKSGMIMPSVDRTYHPLYKGYLEFVSRYKGLKTIGAVHLALLCRIFKRYYFENSFIGPV